MTDEIKMDPATFDLGEFLQGKVSSPEYTVTVYLDGKTAGELDVVRAEVTRLETERERLSKREPEGAGGSLVSVNPTTKRLAEIDAEMKDLRAKGKKLLDTVKGSALTLTFQAKGTSIYKRVLNIMREKYEHMAELSDSDLLQQILENEEYALHQQVVLLSEITTKITNAAGASYPMEKFDVDMAEKVVESVSAPDIKALTTNMNLAVQGGHKADRVVDAGFLG